MKLRIGYLMSGIVTGLLILLAFIWTQPDGKLHVVFCNVGQGDASYVRLPDGRDMLIDGGPDDRVLTCLGRHMPFWDRHIDMVVLSHPQKDHMAGLVSVLNRFDVSYVFKSDVANTSEEYKQFMGAIQKRHIPVKLLTQGDRITIGPTSLLVLWPTSAQIAKAHGVGLTNVLGAASTDEPASVIATLNDYCVVFELHYRTFDVIYPGDADSRVEPRYTGLPLADNEVEVLKVPHHGSKTGLTKDFIEWIHPKLAVISVGNNSYGQPAKEIITILQNIGSQVLRTDKAGDIEVVSDGDHWNILHS
ncbi:MAG TPA: MBL fold metallo-hydrolase [Patescibacteria group bacterium]|nr:MBL fold metallo-hydrolase [Patescibacteria group bacterium]